MMGRLRTSRDDSWSKSVKYARMRNDFCVTLSQQIGFPPPIVPDMVLFSRGYFAQHLIEALQSGAARSRVAPAEDTTGGQTGTDESPSI